MTGPDSGYSRFSTFPCVSLETTEWGGRSERPRLRVTAGVAR
jgi:hypothetical protein